MIAQNPLALINPQNKELAFRIYPFEDDSHFNKLNNCNYFVMVLVAEGTGTLMADVAEYAFGPNSLMCFSLYQPFRIRADGSFKGVMINFHPDFFCLHKHRDEVSCNGVLFNNNYESPVIALDEAEMQALLTIADELKTELQLAELAQFELLISYLKIFLINASRIKLKHRQGDSEIVGKDPMIRSALKNAIEENFKTLHSPADYAELLHTSAKVLNRVSKTYFNKTLSNLIADRIIIEARRELYLTSKAVKLIAYELGFNDEFYFSRFFKSNVAVSPQTFRDTVGFDKANA